MGVKNLNSIILTYGKKGVKKCHLQKYNGKKVAIDANIYLYKYSYAKSNLINGIFFQINKLKKFNIEPVYIFDGKPPKEKKNTLKYRKKKKKKKKIKINALKKNLKDFLNNPIYSKKEKMEYEKYIKSKIFKYEKSLIYINKEVIDNVKNLLNHMGIKYLDAPGEAEHYCVKLIKDNILDMVLSEDMDTVACGANIVLKNFSNKTDYIMEYDFDKIVNEMGINRLQFTDLCIICGNDYIKGIKGIDKNNVLKIINKYSKIENIINSKKYLFPENFNYNQIRDIYNLSQIDTNNFENLVINNVENIPNLIEFLKKNSDIPEKIFRKRIKYMYTNDKISDSNYMTNLKKTFRIIK